MSDVKAGLPGAVMIGGEEFLRTVRGDLIRVANLSPLDQLTHEMVCRAVEYGKGLRAEVSRFKDHVWRDIDAIDEVMLQEYNAKSGGKKGNKTFTSADGRARLSVKVNIPMVIGPEIAVAKTLIDEIIEDWETAAGQFHGETEDERTRLAVLQSAISALADVAREMLDVGRTGVIRADQLRRIKRKGFAHPRWPDVVRAIEDACKDGLSKSYIQLEEWDEPRGGYSKILIDLASVDEGVAAYAYPSLRNQLREAEERAELAEAALRNLQAATNIEFEEVSR